MAIHEQRPLDKDGVPILTDTIPPEWDEPEPRLVDRMPDMPASRIAEELMGSTAFRQELDEVAAEVTRNVRRQIEDSLKPAIEEAIIQALDESGGNTFDTVHHQLLNSLPAIVSSALQEDSSKLA